MAKPKEKVTAEKPDMFEVAKATKFNVGLQCGDCLHYKGSAHPKFEAPCIKRGVGTKSEAPMCYTPDVTVFRSISKDVFPMLASLVGIMTPKQSRVLMGVLKYAGSLEKAGLTFLEVCYFCNCPPAQAFLEDYFCGFAVAMTRSGQIVLVGADYLKAMPSSMIAYLDKSSVLREEVFLARKEKLMASGKIHRPVHIKGARTQQAVLPDYEVPTIDDDPSLKKKGSDSTRKQPKGYVYKQGDYSIG